MPFSIPHGGEEVVRGKRPWIIAILVFLVVCLPFLFMSQNFTIGSGVMQIFIITFGCMTLYTNDLGQMVPWAMMAFFEFVFALVSIIFRAINGAGPSFFGGDSWVRTHLAYGFEIANAVTLFCVLLLTWWTYQDVKRLESALPLNSTVPNYSAMPPRPQSSFTAFAGRGNRLDGSAAQATS